MNSAHLYYTAGPSLTAVLPLVNGTGAQHPTRGYLRVRITETSRLYQAERNFGHAAFLSWDTDKEMPHLGEYLGSCEARCLPYFESVIQSSDGLIANPPKYLLADFNPENAKMLSMLQFNLQRDKGNTFLARRWRKFTPLKAKDSLWHIVATLDHVGPPKANANPVAFPTMAQRYEWDDDWQRLAA